jgi:hypothetical protein
MTSRAIPSNVTAASLFAVQDAHLKASAKSKAERAREHNEQQRQAMERLRVAAAWVASKPALCLDGKPCSYAVEAALRLRRERGEGQVTVAAVQDYRRARLQRAVEHGLFTQAEVDAWITQGRWIGWRPGKESK